MFCNEPPVDLMIFGSWTLLVLSFISVLTLDSLPSYARLRTTSKAILLKKSVHWLYIGSVYIGGNVSPISVVNDYNEIEVKIEYYLDCIHVMLKRVLVWLDQHSY